MQNTKLIKKISTSLVSTGEIIDSLQSNSSTNAPSIRAVVDNMTPPQNLLINGDFQINQRGKTEYNESKDGTYTLDMWRTRQGNYSNAIKMIPKSGGGVTIILPSDGINAGFNQCLPMDESNLGKKFVAVVSKDGKVYDYKFTLATTDVGKYLESGVKLSVTYDNVNKYIRFALYFENSSLQSKTFDIDYCDLYPGEIAYPHQKEDDAIALLRCQDYEIFYETLLLTISYDYNERKFQAVANFPKMKDIPTFTHGQVEMWANTGSMMVIGVESKEALIDRIRITTQTTPYAKKSGTCIIFLHNVNLTCEPL